MNHHPLEDKLDRALDTLIRGEQPPRDPELAGLLNMAGALPDLPAPEFKSKLWAQLERKIAVLGGMSVPRGFRTLTPYIGVPDVALLIRFLSDAFAATVEIHARTPQGGEHVQLRIGDSMLMIGGPVSPGAPVALHLHVDGVDEVYWRAIKAGASKLGSEHSSGEPEDHHYGERSGFIIDPAGNRWYLAEKSTSQLRHGDMGSVTPYLHPASAVQLTDFLKAAFGADEIVRFERDGRVVHAQVRVGDSIVEMGDAAPPLVPDLPSSFFMYVGDVDAVYRQSLEAGATPLYAPAVQHYGVYNAGVTDPFGNRWFPSKPHIQG